MKSCVQSFYLKLISEESSGIYRSYLLQTPHPLYRPSNDLVPSNDPLCIALHSPGNHQCQDPEQCDYEVEYADGGSSLGVLLRDVFALNYSNGIRIKPRLALGFVYCLFSSSKFGLVSIVF